MYGEPVRTKKDSPYIASLLSVIETQRIGGANIFEQHRSGYMILFSIPNTCD